MTMIKGVFFDLYGTLLIFGDMKKAWREWLSVFYLSLQNLGLSINGEEFSILCNNFMSAEEPQLLEGDFTLYEMRIKRFIEDLNIVVTADQIREIAKLTAETWQKDVSVDPDAFEILQKLKEKYVVGLVSNFDHPPHIHKYLKEYGIKDLFDIIIVSAEEGVNKPDPAIFSRIFNNFDLKPSEMLFIGDSEEDMEAAEAAQLNFVLIERSNSIESKNARDFTVDDSYEEETEFKNVNVIHSLDDVTGIIDKLNTE